MKWSTIILLTSFLGLASCHITDFEIAVNTANFEGDYYSDVDCDGRFEDNFRGGLK